MLENAHKVAYDLGRCLLHVLVGRVQDEFHQQLSLGGAYLAARLDGSGVGAQSRQQLGGDDLRVLEQLRGVKEYVADGHVLRDDVIVVLKICQIIFTYIFRPQQQSQDFGCVGDNLLVAEELQKPQQLVGALAMRAELVDPILVPNATCDAPYHVLEEDRHLLIIWLCAG